MTDRIAPTNAAQILEGTISLLSDPSKWGKDVMAVDATGETVQPYDNSATCFCILGAISRAAYGIVPDGDIREFFMETYNIQKFEDSAIAHVLTVTNSRYGVDVPTFNDKIASHESVMSVLNRALELAKEKA